jgi:hypothetical protein
MSQRIAEKAIWEEVEEEGVKFQRLVVPAGHPIPDGVDEPGPSAEANVEADADTDADTEGKAVDGPQENKARSQPARKGRA